ncbi:probable ADP-ribosylation factor GTPase-activating protein AGD14 [Morus notabilis]|uniref:probable ADP-ribosylation factor GTPase-activating protein AGD14 n=1 Tax=Morus notabilis TaxID=981085 RepID=UPI000CED06EE|nr:probable ADP-ribosylation factor GTPase-activating protein AGD14 [Morus notabilis]
MAKFTSEEVEALQNGGNQRAREIYLKDWDLQRQRLLDSSDADKIRQFIKDVYVDRRYAGGKPSDKPPRDMQNRGVREDETRRASSYHSYSQSPPYDYQYEDRRYGKQVAALTRKPGSDRGGYGGKVSGFVYSPDRLSEQMYDDRFANEDSFSRVSDYSVSSGGDPFRSGTQSPNFQKDIGFSSPTFQPSRGVSSEDLRSQARFPERSRSAGSFGSIDSNFMSQKSFNSGGFTDDVLKSEQAADTFQERSSFPGSSVPGRSDSLDLFKAPTIPKTVYSAAPVDLFKLPEAPSALSPPSLVSSASSANEFQPTQTSPTYLECFAVAAQPESTKISNEILREFSVPKSEGWATFDVPQPSTPISSNEKISPTGLPSGSRGSVGKVDMFSSLDTSMQWPSVQNSSSDVSSNISSAWNDSLLDLIAPNATRTQESEQLWNAFEDSLGQPHFEDIKQNGALLVGTDKVSSAVNQQLGLTAFEISSSNSMQRTSSHGEPPAPVSSSLVMGPSCTPPMLPLMGEMESHSTDRESTNPFDIPYDSELEENNMFMDMSSLQAALPNDQLSSSFLGGVSQSWFPPNSVTPYIPSAGQGGVTYPAPQAPSSQIPNAPAQGPVASIGGNPFA